MPRDPYVRRKTQSFYYTPAVGTLAAKNTWNHPLTEIVMDCHKRTDLRKKVAWSRIRRTWYKQDKALTSILKNSFTKSAFICDKRISLPSSRLGWTTPDLMACERICNVAKRRHSEIGVWASRKMWWQLPNRESSTASHDSVQAKREQ